MKRIPLLTLLCPLALLLLPGNLIAQQKPGLLWRISGKGLSQPSWLYGTIHLTDKRVFNFGDSLYAALEKSEGYAMEVHPDSIAKEALKEVNDDALLLKDTLAPKEFNLLKKKLQAAFNKSPDQVTVKEFKRRATESATRVDKNSMHTIMDAYFYNATRRMGKWGGGIEDVADQLPMRNTSPLEEYVQDFMNDNKGSKKGIEEMINIYRAEDLDAIASKRWGGTEFIKDSIMLRRNNKMSRRMDSLAHIRSMFFAVGAAHLPGDSGVVNLLRLRGFTVEPVVSSKRIDANTYHFPVKEIPWVTATSNDGLYTVQLPGETQDLGPRAGNLDMKVYVDISSNIAYLAMADSKKVNDADSMLAGVVKRMNNKARIVETKAIVYDSVRGKEVIAKAPDASYRIRMLATPLTSYVLLVSSPVDSAILSADAERFFKSLVMNKTARSNSSGWNTYRNARHGFSLTIPGKISVKYEDGDDRKMVTTHYNSIDIMHGIYFQCLVQDMKRGFYLSGDSAAFDSYLRVIKNDSDSHLLSQSPDSVQHYPAFRMEFTSVSEGETTYNKVLSIHRGNRIYYLFATVADPVKSKEAIDRYFNSFSFIPVKEANWSLQPAPDNSFSVWSSLPVRQTIDTAEEEQKNNILFYTIYDSTAPGTYHVTKTPYSRYFWTDSDTSLLRREADAHISYTDSILSYTPVTNGNYKGVEIMIRLRDNHNRKKMRLLLVGDSLYTIFGTNANEFLDQENSRRIFEDFRVNHNTASTLFTNKAQELLTALQSPDSLTFSEAKATLRKVVFTRQDLPLLHKAMLERYRDADGYYGAAGLLFEAVRDLKDETTIELVKQRWTDLPADKEDLRYELLRLVAAQKTNASASLMRDLLLKHIPRAGESFQLFNDLSDSLKLVAPLLPDLLPLLKDSIAKDDIVMIVHKLLDSNLVDIALLNKYKKELYGIAAYGMKHLKKNSDDRWYGYDDLIKVLVKLKDPVAFQWVRKMLVQPDIDVKHTAAIALLKSGQPVEAAEWLKLAADNGIREVLYEELEELKKTALFPRQYYTEKAFAESDLYTYANDDNDVKKITYIGERTAMYKGERKRFYLFIVDLSYEDEKVIHLGIAGPFGLKPGKPVTDGAAATGIHWDKEYKAATINADLKAYLEQLEKYDE